MRTTKDVSIAYNKLLKRVKVFKFDMALTHKPEDLIHHLCCGKTSDFGVLCSLFTMDDDDFLECMSNAANIIDLNNEED
jgi:hypothetical protein